MLGYDQLFIALFALFLLSSKTRATAFILLFSYLIYYFWATQYDGLSRYMAFGTLELFAGLFILHKLKDTSIAETFFISVFVNVTGGLLYWYYYSPVYYDNICILIMIIQILIMSWRVFKDGRLITRYCNLYPIFSAFISNINQRHSLLFRKKGKS